MAGRKLKFPDPKDYAAKHIVVLCPAERVIGLYEQETGEVAERIAKTVQTWFSAEAAKRGWAGCRFVPEVQSTHGAGAILLNPVSTKLVDHKIVLQLPKDDKG